MNEEKNSTDTNAKEAPSPTPAAAVPPPLPSAQFVPTGQAFPAVHAIPAPPATSHAPAEKQSGPAKAAIIACVMFALLLTVFYGFANTRLLNIAARNGNTSFAGLLIALGTNPNGSGSIHPLCEAVTHGNPEMVRYLISKGADTELSKQGLPLVQPLHLAAAAGNKKIVKILLENDADVNNDLYGDRATPLMVAAGNGHHEIVQMLLEAGADPSHKDLFERTALDYVNDSRYTVKEEDAHKTRLLLFQALQG